MDQNYQNWKLQEFPTKQQPEFILEFIENMVNSLSQFYGFVGLQSNEIQILFKFIFAYLQKYPRFKLCDIERSIELFKKKPDLNKLTPEWFENVFEKYRKSDERKIILKTWEDDIEAHKNELQEAKKEYDANELLQACFNIWKQSKVVQLNSGLVYEKNFALLKERIGIDKMEELRQQTQKRLIVEQKEQLQKTPKKSSIRDLMEDALRLVENGEGVLKRETRKAHLKYYFEMLEFETA